MSGCCDLPGCERSQPILLLRGGLTGVVFAITRWHREWDSRGYNERVVADEKHIIPAEDVLRVDEIRAAQAREED